MRVDHSGANAIVTAARLQLQHGATAAAAARSNQTSFHERTPGRDFWHRVACVLETGGPSDAALQHAEAELDRRRREFMGQPVNEEQDKLARANAAFSAARTAPVDPTSPPVHRWWEIPGGPKTLKAAVSPECGEAFDAAERAAVDGAQERIEEAFTQLVDDVVARALQLPDDAPPPAATPDPPPATDRSTIPTGEPKQEKLF